MKALPRPGPGGGYFRTAVWAILDDARTLDEARTLAARAGADCSSWEDAVNLVGGLLVREWLPDGASILDPIPEVARERVIASTVGRWIRRRQARIVQQATTDALAAICERNAELGVPVDAAYARVQMRRWLYPERE